MFFTLYFNNNYNIYRFIYDGIRDIKKVTSPVEFSKFYNLLDSVKKGEEGTQAILEDTIKSYEEGIDAESELHQLGELFLFIGIKKLYEYSKNKDLKYIGNLNKEEWEILAKENDSELPQYLAKSMIKYVKQNDSSKKIANRWNKSKREVDKHTTRMSRYITEGIIDVLE